MVEGKVFWYALQSAREEGLMLLAFLLSVYGIIKAQGFETADIIVWNIVLLVQAIPYLAAVIMSLISAFSRLSAKKLITRITAHPASVVSGSAPEGDAQTAEGKAPQAAETPGPATGKM